MPRADGGAARLALRDPQSLRPERRASKLALLRRCAACRLTSAARVTRYHELLLFLAAYPDDRTVAAAVDDELQRVAGAAAALDLKNSGIANTLVECSFAFDTLRWLVRRFPDRIDLVWRRGSAGTALEELLPALLSSVERDALHREGQNTQTWFRHARGDAAGSDLAWLLEHLPRLGCSPPALDYVFESLRLLVRWSLDAPGVSTTSARFPPRPLHGQRGPLRRRVDLRRELRRSLPPSPPLKGSAAMAMIESAQAACFARRRESDPLVFANPEEVTLLRLDRGVDVALFGMRPERRLPIESFFGYVIARNRVPVGYGGGWVFDRRAEIGVNIFDAFRGGESALLFAQVLRVYHRQYGVRHFLVDPYQFGAGNAEGIRSGAFWFYYRLGFRPSDGELAEEAAAEFARISADRTLRTPARLLRRLTRSKLVWRLDRKKDQPLDLSRLGLAITRAIGERFDGDRERAERSAQRRVSKLLAPGDRRRWSPSERQAFDRLSLLAALLPGLEDLSPTNRRTLVALMRAKGAPREQRYVELVQGHEAFRASLARLAASVGDV